MEMLEAVGLLKDICVGLSALLVAYTAVTVGGELRAKLERELSDTRQIKINQERRLKALSCLLLEHGPDIGKVLLATKKAASAYEAKDADKLHSCLNRLLIARAGSDENKNTMKDWLQ